MSGFGQFGTFWLASWVVWKIPARRAAKLAEFSHTEEGSSLDMMAAAEGENVRPNLRRKFFIHALDEHKHARWFADRATALTTASKPARRILEDVNYIRDHGIRGDKSLYEQMGVVEFLACVWLQGRQAGRQFGVYVNLLKDDPVTAEIFQQVRDDERFHTNYSRLELDRMAKAGDQAKVRRAVWNVKFRGLRQSWLRLARGLGELMAGIWLLLLYIILTPFGVAARWFDRDTTGFVATPNARQHALGKASLQG